MNIHIYNACTYKYMSVRHPCRDLGPLALNNL